VTNRILGRFGGPDPGDDPWIELDERLRRFIPLVEDELSKIFKRPFCPDSSLARQRAAVALRRTGKKYDPSVLGSNCDQDLPRAIRVAVRQAMRQHFAEAASR
jgi:hypothetical protein